MLLETEKKRLPVHIQILILLVFVLISIVFNYLLTDFQKKYEVENWNVELADSGMSFQKGRTEDIQIFVLNEKHEPLTKANVRLEINEPNTDKSVSVVMHHLEAGLYESEVLFSESGYWNILVNVENEQYYYEKNLYVEVNSYGFVQYY
ncbi:FixH family protein [Alkalihalobacillus sp. 1P02AB]|uniref:FixH family protein n=1 Tax=Alkalihalobacillus sp. 1P02AB TaxID=3132260 RepID=UPI0039A69C40